MDFEVIDAGHIPHDENPDAVNKDPRCHLFQPNIKSQTFRRLGLRAYNHDML